jgi:hypothetical protein
LKTGFVGAQDVKSEKGATVTDAELKAVIADLKTKGSSAADISAGIAQLKTTDPKMAARYDAIQAKDPAVMKAKIDAAISKASPSYIIPGTPETASPKTPPCFKMGGTDMTPVKIGTNPDKTPMMVSKADKLAMDETNAITAHVKKVPVEVEVMIDGVKTKVKVDSAMITAATRGRCTFAELQAVTQLLIKVDGGVVLDGKTVPPTAENIRRLQMQWSIGVDCAGSTAQLTAAAQGKSPGEVWNVTDKGKFVGGWQQGGANTVAQHKWPERKPLTDASPGDVFIQAAPEGDVGHVLTVCGTEKVGAKDYKSEPMAGFCAPNPSACVRYEIWSSNGFHGSFSDSTGLTKRYYVYNPTTNMWAVIDPNKKPEQVVIASKPGYVKTVPGGDEEQLQGIYRPPG